MPPRIGPSQPEVLRNVENSPEKEAPGKTHNSREVKKQKAEPHIPKDSTNKRSEVRAKSIKERLVSATEPEARSRMNSSSSADSGFFSDNESIASSDSFSSSTLERTDSLMSNDSVDSAFSDASESSEIGAAGHSDTFAKVGDNHIGKLTNKSEADVYSRRKSLLLDTILPKNKPVSALNDNELNILTPLLNRAEADDMSVIVPEMLGKDIPEQQKLEMDIKIGFKTASRDQLKETGHSSPLKKTMKHKVMDRAYGSNSRGYRLEGLKVKGEKPEKSRLKLTRNSQQHIKKVIMQAGPENKEKILADLKTMRTTLAISKAAFVASSALFLIDEKNPENTLVKLIDVAHPIYPSSKEFKGIQSDNVKSLNSLISYIEKIETT